MTHLATVLTMGRWYNKHMHYTAKEFIDEFTENDDDYRAIVIALNALDLVVWSHEISDWTWNN